MPRPVHLATMVAVAMVAGVGAHAASVTHTAGFRDAGGDIGYGNGDIVTNPALYGGFLPLFDSSLGVLDRVTVEMSAWRSMTFTCQQGEATSGSCGARADGQFVLRADSYDPYQFPLLAVLPVSASQPTLLTPPPGTAQTDVSYAEAETSFDVTDAALLSVHFDGAGKNPAQTYFTLYFQSLDGGSFGYGAGAAMTALYWDGDASVSMTYHYTPAVPEPAAGALLAAGLAVLGWRARRRRVA